MPQDQFVIPLLENLFREYADRYSLLPGIDLDTLQPRLRGPSSVPQADGRSRNTVALQRRWRVPSKPSFFPWCRETLSDERADAEQNLQAGSMAGVSAGGHEVLEEGLHLG